MSAPDIAGLVGVGMMLLVYGATAMGRLPATDALALLCNLVGAGLVLFSLAYAPNVPALIMESAWFLVAAAGLVRLAFRRRR